MVFLRKLLILIVIATSLPAFAYDSWVTRDGYYIDGTGQVEGSDIYPPHPEKIPAPRAVQDITSFERYYDRNIEGKRIEENSWKNPDIPNYNVHYSTRSPHTYTKQDYINVWCSGEKVGKVDCMTDEYAISFFPVSQWFRGIVTANLRARKYPQKGMAFLYVDEIGGDARYMQEAKRWASQYNSNVFFGTIDKGIPMEWIPQ